MSTKEKRIVRKVTRGSVVCHEDVPHIDTKPGVVLVSGRPYVELVDGRVVETNFPRQLSWPYLEMHDGHPVGTSSCPYKCKRRS